MIFIDDEKLRFNNKLTRCISDGDWYIPPVLLFGGLIVITLITLYLYKPVYDLENAPEFRDYQKELALIKKFKDNPDWVMKSDLNTDSKNLVEFCLSPSFDFDSSSEHNGMRRVYHHVDIPSFEGDDWLIGCLVHHDEVLKYLRYKEVKEKMGY